MVRDMPHVQIYTDGGCRPNPGPGGWGVVLLFDGQEPEELSGSEQEATNNRMELRAAIEALRALDGPHRVDLVTDSTYVRKGITEWLDGWRRNGWKTSQKQPVKNCDLWRELAGELTRHDVSWHWTKGHAGDRWNERADALATAAMPRPPLPVDDFGAVHLFAAAAFSGKRQIGGWGAVMCFREHRRELNGSRAATTANRMHLEAAVAGLTALKKRSRVHLYTTSDYLKDGATAWIRSWRARSWQTRDGKPVKNRDLWERLAQALEEHSVTWHVAARDDVPEDLEAAKELAAAAIKGDSDTTG